MTALASIYWATKSKLTELLTSDSNQQMQINEISTKIDALNGLYNNLNSEVVEGKCHIEANSANIDQVIENIVI